MAPPLTTDVSKQRSQIVLDESTYLGEYLIARKYDSDYIYGKMKSDSEFPIPVFNLLFTEYGLDWLSRRLERETRPFSSTYLTDGKRKHASVSLEVSAGAILIPSSPLIPELRPGLLPYSVPGAGSYSIIYRDALKRELGRRTISNPATVRVCDFSDGEDAGILPVEEGTIELLVPADSRIKYLELRPFTGSSIEIPVEF